MDAYMIAVIGVISTLIGVTGTLLTTRWRLRTEQHDADEQHVIDYYTNELAHCRTESAMWRSLALENMGGLQKAVSVIEEQHQQQTGGQE